MNILSAKCSRRDVLKLATTSSLVTLLSAFSGGCSLNTPDLESAAKKMTRALQHLVRAREIGEAYLAKQNPDKQAGVEQLTRELLVTLKLNPDNITDETLDLIVPRLQTQVRQDFVDENIVIVDSWMLSRTELMLCVLAASYTNPKSTYIRQSFISNKA